MNPARKLHIILVSFMFITFSSTTLINAQMGDPIFFEYDYLPSSKLSNPQESGPYDNNLEISYERLAAGIAFPLYMKKGTVIINGFDYSRLNVEYDNWDYNLYPENTFGSFYAINYMFLIRK